MDDALLKKMYLTARTPRRKEGFMHLSRRKRERRKEAKKRSCTVTGRSPSLILFAPSVLSGFPLASGQVREIF
jgi:hypothetical protein